MRRSSCWWRNARQPRRHGALRGPTRFATNWRRRAWSSRTRRTACAGSGSDDDRVDLVTTGDSRRFLMEFEIIFDREEDGRWIAEIASLPGVLAYGGTQLEAQSKVEAL